MSLICLYEDLEYKENEKLNRETQNYFSGIKTDFNDIIRLLKKDNIEKYIEYLEEKYNHFQNYKKNIENEGFYVKNDLIEILKLRKICCIISEQINSTNEEKINIESGLLNKYSQYRYNSQLEKELNEELKIENKEGYNSIIKTKNYKIIFNKEFDILLCFKDNELVELNNDNKRKINIEIEINEVDKKIEDLHNNQSNKRKKAP